ncbi:PREDICTED: secretory carrier-associated membrane protein 2 isoform X1 [Nanorana parkeri]|uniref:secretory carrier-associated membrane protein 2 isoform X1 n=1 Tax=Nanorana parkeri TaxID=125878 RepID=UPI0008543BFE|nr:PREDICTED: secretory carrier-associated membrane protein 2 isoform X1 [Nanorana parkeri]
MAGFDTNPFADPVDVNPFQDPSVTQITATSQGNIEEFNPFTESSRLTTNQKTVPVQPVMPSQPAVLQPSIEPSPQAVAMAAQAGLLQQQEELDRKAAEIERKEKEMRNVNINLRQNNWPPLPPNCPIKPCFYQDFSADIPADYQRTCKMLYYLWMFHGITLFLNLLACLAYFTSNTESGGVDFGLSILWFVLFTPCAFLCWFRPIYKAFRTDSSFNFFLFFLIFACQIVIYIIQAVGIPHWGDSGWIMALTMINTNVAVAVIMMVVATFFTVSAVFSLFMLKKVHSMYRRTGASFQRAQEEFSQGILSNRNVQNAATGAATAAARGAFQGN